MKWQTVILPMLMGALTSYLSHSQVWHLRWWAFFLPLFVLYVLAVEVYLKYWR